MAVVIDNTQDSGKEFLQDTTAPYSIVIDKPTNVVDGNDVFGVFAIAGSSDLAVTFTPPSGWEELYTGPTAVGTMCIWVGRKRAASEPSTYTFAATVDTGTGQHSGAIVFRLTGADNTTFSDATPVASNGNSTDPATSSITSVTANAMILSIIATNDGRHIVSEDANQPSGMTCLYLKTTGASSSGVSLGIAFAEQAVAGASGTKTWTGALSTGNVYRGVAIAIRPAAGGGGVSIPVIQNHRLRH